MSDYNNYEYKPQALHHGASIIIATDGDKIIHYTGDMSSGTYPNVRSHKDGLRVGCTFISNEALEKLYRLHKDYINEQDYKVHQ